MHLDKQQERFQAMLAKDLQASCRVKELRKKESQRIAVKSSLRNLRHSVVRSKRYFKDFEDNIKLQLQQLNIAEEQALCDAFDKINSVITNDIREVEKDLLAEERKKIMVMHDNAKKLRGAYRSALSNSAATTAFGTVHSQQVLGKDQLLLLSQVKRNKECIEAHLRDTDSRTHHRVLHSHLLPYKIPKPCLKRLL